MKREKRRVCSCPVGKFLVSSENMGWMIVSKEEGESIIGFLTREGICDSDVYWKPLPAPATALDMGEWKEGFPTPYKDVLVQLENGDVAISYAVVSYDGSINWEYGTQAVCWTEL